MLRHNKIIPSYIRKEAMKTASLGNQAPVELMSERAPKSHQKIAAGGIRGNVLAVSVMVLLLSLLSACTSDSGKPAEPEKPENKGPELITARSAFQKLYVAARGWNQDAKPYRISSIATRDRKSTRLNSSHIPLSR